LSNFPIIGYDRAAQIAKESAKTGRTVREICEERSILPPRELAIALDPVAMTKPGGEGSAGGSRENLRPRRCAVELLKKQTPPIRGDGIIVEPVIRYVYHGVAIQEVGPVAIGWEGDIDPLGAAGEIENDHEPLELTLGVIPPAVINGHLEPDVDAVAVR